MKPDLADHEGVVGRCKEDCKAYDMGIGRKPREES